MENNDMDSQIPLPKGSSQYVKSALIHIVSSARIGPIASEVDWRRQRRMINIQWLNVDGTNVTNEGVKKL